MTARRLLPATQAGDGCRCGRRWTGWVFTAALGVVLLLGPRPAVAGEHTSAGLYDPQIYTLANGLRVVLQPRHHARTVAFRLAVDVGAWDFPCGEQELPHFIEHMVFTGTSAHDEQALEALVARHGGGWNAETGPEDTVYSLNIHSRHAEFALGLLHEVLADPTFPEEKIELVRNIVYRENGGNPSALRRWLKGLGIGKSAVEQLIERTGLACPGPEPLEYVTRDRVVEVGSRHYVPQNMTLVVVGDFQREAMQGRIAETFGRLPPVPPPPRASKTRDRVGALPARLISSFSPFVDSEVSVGLLSLVEGYTSDDYAALRLLAAYLKARLFETIRIDRGLSYSPESSYLSFRRMGLLSVDADAEPEDAEVVLSLLRDELTRLSLGSLDAQTLADARQQLLLAEDQGLESNQDVAGYYVSSLGELEEFGHFRDERAALEQLGDDTLRAVARRLLSPEDAVEVREAPTLTYGQLYAVLGLLGAGVGAVAWRLGARRRRRGAFARTARPQFDDAQAPCGPGREP